jgi:Transglutaminase-like superfamily
MFLLFFEAYVTLIRFEVCMRPRTFASLYKKVRNCPIRGRGASNKDVERICYAVDLACIWYRKEVLCLQRSAATACMLKKHGAPAQMVLGAQQTPFKAHAWVELGGRVVNDKPYIPEMYSVLDRC